MFCTKCGSPMPEKSRFCGKCGNPVSPQVPAPGPAVPPPPSPPGPPVPPPPPPQQAGPVIPPPGPVIPAQPPTRPVVPPPPPPPRVAPVPPPPVQPPSPAVPVQPPPPAGSAPPSPGTVGITPPGIEKLVVHWKSTPGKHPSFGRTGFQVIITDKRIILGKSGLLARLGSGAAIGGAMSAVAGGVAQAAAGAAVSALGSTLNLGTSASLDEKRNVSSEEVDQVLASNPKLIQIPNEAISVVQMKKGGLLSESKVSFHIPEGVFQAEFGGYKDTLKAFQVIFGGRVTTT
jgi:hypothetical protein